MQENSALLTAEMNRQEENTAKAFGKQAAVFDTQNEENVIVAWMREKVRKQVLNYLKPGDTILELNCGTGIDTIFFAEHGYDVYATDLTAPMLDELEKKTELLHLQDKIQIRQLSFLDLPQLGNMQFDHVFSNFGGLNCTDRLDKVLQDMSEKIKPGGYCTLVIMPHFSPWEFLALLKGKFRYAFRRFGKKGSDARVEGLLFRCWYYNPSFVIHHLPDFTLCKLEALGIFVPAPHSERLMRNRKNLFNFLAGMENMIAGIWPFNRWGDHYVITLKKK